MMKNSTVITLCALVGIIVGIAGHFDAKHSRAGGEIAGYGKARDDVVSLYTEKCGSDVYYTRNEEYCNGIRDAGFKLIH